MIEHVERTIVVGEHELERLACAGIEHDDAGVLGVRVPEQRHLDAVGRPEVKLSWQVWVGSAHGDSSLGSIPVTAHDRTHARVANWGMHAFWRREPSVCWFVIPNPSP